MKNSLIYQYERMMRKSYLCETRAFGKSLLCETGTPARRMQCHANKGGKWEEKAYKFFIKHNLEKLMMDVIENWGKNIPKDLDMSNL